MDRLRTVVDDMAVVKSVHLEMDAARYPATSARHIVAGAAGKAACSRSGIQIPGRDARRCEAVGIDLGRCRAAGTMPSPGQVMS
jgi:hypothetical protein